jgi:hypothetical protein
VLIVLLIQNLRHYHQLYKVNGSTGHVEWTLGGKQSTWSLGNNTQFSWQHDARWVEEGSVISLFDDASACLRLAKPGIRPADSRLAR